MKDETIKQFVQQLDGMIATIGGAVVFGRTKEQKEAMELMKDARLKLIEDLEKRNVSGFELPKERGSRGYFIAGDTTIAYGHQEEREQS